VLRVTKETQVIQERLALIALLLALKVSKATLVAQEPKVSKATLDRLELTVS
tara:strand:- start:243 stop:398 length:156 start_codon:yes stop_codon:yes gene_type:complete